MAFKIPSHLLQSFIEQGLIPQDCSSMEIRLSREGVPTLCYEVMVTKEKLLSLSRAFADLGQKFAF